MFGSISRCRTTVGAVCSLIATLIVWAPVAFADPVVQLAQTGSGTSHPDIVACDEAASHPADPERRAIGVPDERMVPVTAIELCETALQRDPGNPRIHYQLGRALWLAAREGEAFSHFVAAAYDGYGPALAGLAEAYVSGRGLPAGEAKDLVAALHFFERAAQARFRPAEAEVIWLRDFLKEFDEYLFQNPVFANLLYVGNFSNIQKEDHEILLAFTSYINGFIRQLDSEQFYDHYKECQPLLDKIGILSAEWSQVNQLFLLMQNSDGLSFENFLPTMLLMGRHTHIAEDQGWRDASVMAENYNGCKSDVSRRMVAHLMESGPFARGVFKRLVAFFTAGNPELRRQLNGLFDGIDF